MDYSNLVTVNRLNIKNTLSITASISTILQFLSGTLVCLQIVRQKSTGDYSALPLICGTFSSFLWLCYGFLKLEHSLMLVNMVGATLYFSYMITFCCYSRKKSGVCCQISICILVIIAVIIYICSEQKEEVVENNIGILCCLATVVFFSSPLATFFHVLKVKNTESLPFPIIIMTFVVSIQWYMYGVLLDDLYIQLPNLIGCLLSAFQLSLFLIFPSRRPLSIQHEF